MREAIICTMVIDRKILLDHAEKVLSSEFTGVELAKKMQMNVNQFYDYRNGSKQIGKARLETLIRFEKAYKFINE